MPYLLDTNHCIYLMNGWNKPEQNLLPEERNTVEGFRNIGDDVIYLSEASFGELVYGIERSQRKEFNQRNFEVLIRAVPPISVNRGVWEIYGRTKALLSKLGKKIPDIDLLIAATAKQHGLTLVAQDKHMKSLPDHFLRENWAKTD